MNSYQSKKINIEKELNQLGIKPVHGQNFLNHKTYIKALIEAAEIEEKHNILEIGPGTGHTTKQILQKNPKKIKAIEKDTKLSNHLKNKFKNNDKVEILNKDFLQYEIPENIDRAVSNLPFQISTQAIEKLGEKQIQSSLILQKELAQTLTAEPGDKDNYKHLTITAQYYFLPVKLRDIPSTAYTPEPEVTTSLIKLYPNKKRHKIQNEKLFFKISKALFTHKTKKTRNAFEDTRHILDISKDKAKKWKDEIPHNQERVFKLEIKQLKEITQKYNQLKKQQ